ncbi:hypothetical protein [Hymenobacter glacieicola]|uniref:HTH cro/C1-type domain-containing protein n=1 Tax=Hymenobacter glacieicola TaxID=1562124 RepID=A0ABQ1X0A1_9BACT|nr:hypothetical protein [Hymenobacter glacieicola]GGG51008.1 hypothetical protein GCM10011378_29000 [Hymenobacter glacieicola]
MELLRLKPSAFAAKLDMKPQTLNGFTGPKQSGVTLKTIQKILAVFPRVNSHWLITGEGEPLAPLQSPEAVAALAADQPLLAQDGSLIVAQEAPATYSSPLFACRQELEQSRSRIRELEDIIADKQLIIDLLRDKQQGPV